MKNELNFHQLACLSQFSKQRQKDNTNLGWRRISWSLQKFEQLCDFLLELIQGVLHFPWNTWPWFLSSYICRQKNRTSASSYGSSKCVLHRNSRTSACSKKTIKQDSYSLPQWETKTTQLFPRHMKVMKYIHTHTHTKALTSKNNMWP